MLIDYACDSFAQAARIISAGYPVQVHTVQTEDGYILRLIRIPHGREVTVRKNLKPVFMMHAFLESSSGWLVQGPGKSIGNLIG